MKLRLKVSLPKQGFFVFDFDGIADANANHVDMPASSYEFDFAKNTMTFRIDSIDNTKSDYENNNDDLDINEQISFIEQEINNHAEQGHALEVAELQHQLQKQRILLQSKARQIRIKNDLNHATFDLSYFNDSVGENILVQYIRSFVRLADTPVVNSTGNGNMLAPMKRLDKRSAEYKEEVKKRQFIDENRKVIKAVASSLDQLLNNVFVEYIQAHAATQKLILNAEDKQDVNSKVIHEYYQENILSGERTDRFVKKWLKEFEIGKSINIIPLDGEGYYVKVDNGENEVHLADMGMGSIQLIILLLRLATIGNRSDATNQPWWIIIEEPEQNLHPMLQSKLADLFEDFTQTFCDPYSNTLIVETHSEYLIRKTQLIVGDIYSNIDYLEELSPFKVYYFPSERERQPYEMKYQENGLFEKQFDSGFFDEAGRMHMEILKRSRIKKK